MKNFIKRVTRWYVSKNEYMFKFDVTYERVWKKRYSYSKDSNRNYRFYNILQNILMILGTFLIIGSFVSFYIFGISKELLLGFIIAGMTIYLSELVVLNIILWKSKYHEREMKAIKDTFSKLFSGYNKLGLADKIALIDAFDVKYRNVLFSRINRYLWAVVGILIQIASVVYEIIVSEKMCEETSLGGLLVLIIVMLVLMNFTGYFLSGRAFNPGHYKQVTVRYREWLLKTEGNI